MLSIASPIPCCASHGDIPASQTILAIHKPMAKAICKRTINHMLKQECQTHPLALIIKHNIGFEWKVNNILTSLRRNYLSNTPLNASFYCRREKTHMCVKIETTDNCMTVWKNCRLEYKVVTSDGVL